MRFLTLPFTSRVKRRLSFVAACVVAAFGFLAFAEWRVERAAQGKLTSLVSSVSLTDVAVVLGAAKWFEGRPNLYYEARLNAAAALYRAGRVRAIIVSGDNSRASYSEPDDMKADLVRRGIPEARITCDYAGLRTLDSILRVRRIFGQQKVVLVSQRFHLERALYLASFSGLDAVGFVASDVTPRHWLQARARESLARGAAVLDVTLGRGPKYLGHAEHVLGN